MYDIPSQFEPEPSLSDLLEEAGIGMADLDDIVHDVADSMAMRVNSDSLEAQVKFLEDNGCKPELLDLLNARKNDILPVD